MEENNNLTPETEPTPASDPAQEPEKKYTDADVDEIVKRKRAKWQEEQTKALEAEKAKADEAAKLAAMNATEKAEYEKAQLQAEVDALKAEKQHNLLSAEVRKSLAEAGVSAPDGLVDTLVRSTADDTKAAVAAFIQLYSDAVNVGVKDALKGSAPTGGAPAPAITKAEIMAVKDTIARQRLIAEHMELFT